MNARSHSSAKFTAEGSTDRTDSPYRRGFCLGIAVASPNAVRFVIAVVIAAVTAVGANADTSVPKGSAIAGQALALCKEAQQANEDQQEALLERAQKLAERAVAEHQGDPTAHFAMFCSLGRRLEIEGVGFGSLEAIRRLRREIDTALALAPQWVDAKVGKGALLMRLPRLLGGDPDEGQRLLRDAIAADPDHVDARAYLDEATGCATD